jgi:hypothetical protein
MSATVVEPVLATPPHVQVWQLAMAVVPSRALQVIADIGVADHFAPGGRATAATLAAQCGVNALALDRTLRLLSAHGIFECDGTGFGHTAASELLRSDHPQSMRAFARLNGLPVTRGSIAALDHAVATGRPGAEQVDGRGFFGYLSDHPDEAKVFAQAMTDKARADISDLLAVLDFTPFRTIADIAGGQGHLLRAILDSAPKASGILFDLPDVISRLDPTSDRLRLHAGDFFTDPLPTADVYLLMEILHDWADREATAILAAIRRAAEPGATLLIIEHIPPDDGVDLVSQTLDVLMLTVTGGRERTHSQFATLLESAGLTLVNVIDTGGPLKIIEAAVASGNSTP